MNTIRIYLTESGRIADLQKDFPLYQGQFQNKLLNVFVPTSILAPMFTSSGAVSADYVASTSTKIGMTYTARDGSIKTSKNYYMRYLKTLMYKGVEYALYERKLPKEFTFYAGQGENSPVLIINVVNIEQQSGDTPPLVLSVITSQTCHLDVMQSTFLDRDELDEPSELENLNAQVQALNALMPKKQDKEDESIALEQAPTEKTVVGAINKLGGLVKTAQSSADTAQQTAETAQTTADNATTLANNAVATANGAVATANEAKGIAQTAETNANNAVDKANAANATADEAKAIAQGSQRAIGFATLQAAITALNGYSNTQLKVGDNVYIVETGVPDLWVAAVEQNSVAYNYTTTDAFNDDLVENTLVQVGYYKFAYLESDGKPCTVAWQNMVVAESDWVASTEFEDFAYEAKIILTDFVNFSSIPQVVFGLTEATSGNYAPICKAGDKGVYIYSKVNTAITLPTVVTFAPNVHGASMQGGGYNNRGKWVASTTYAIDDLVYTDNGQYVCIEGITSTTSPEQDTTHWQATFVATGKTKNGLTISGQNTDGSAVQKTFDGSQAVEVAFDENTMTAKEVNGVLKVGAKGTVPEALPQEASALKSGELPTTGWTSEIANIVTTTAQLSYSNDTIIAQIDTDIAKLKTGWEITLTGDNQEYSGTYYNQYSSEQNRIVYKFDFDGGNHLYELTDKFGNTRFSLKIYGNGEIKMSAANRNAEGTYVIGIKNTTYSQWVLSISDTSITTNSDILMELTDDGGVKAQALESGKITVIRDTVPTQPIPYTYKVKQTNASGQFTLVNHYVPSIPDSPTSLPVTYKKVSGELPTSGWNTTNPNLITSNIELHIKQEETQLSSLNKKIDSSYFNYTGNWQVKKYGTSTSTSTASYISTINGQKYRTIEFPNPALTSEKYTLFIDESGNLYRGGGSSYFTTPELYALNAMYAYTISDADITANTSVKMYLTDEGGVKAQSKANGSIQVIRDTVPTTAIPYEYEVEQTSAEGLFEVINAYVPAVPTKTSQLTNDSNFAKTTEANTWTGVQTFSNSDGIKTDRVHNLDNNDAWYNFDGSNNRFGSPSRPTIIRTSEARPRAQVPSGETTVTKEIALLEDIPSAATTWGSGATGNLVLYGKGAGVYQIKLDVEGSPCCFAYWDGTSDFGYCSSYVSMQLDADGFWLFNYEFYIEAKQIKCKHYAYKMNGGTVTKEIDQLTTSFTYRKITN
jgi:hypothetical protein